MLLIPQLPQKRLQFRRCLIAFGFDLLGGDGVFIPQIFDGGDAGALVGAQV